MLNDGLTLTATRPPRVRGGPPAPGRGVPGFLNRNDWPPPAPGHRPGSYHGGLHRLLEACDPSKPSPIQWSAADGILPEPQVFQPRVDHSRTRTWSVERVAWLPWHADQDALRNALYLEGQKLVAHTAAASAENIQTAKLTAETVLKALYAEVGWNVAVRWASTESPKAVAQ